nr:unnamed protein product [Callosobruchus chinensis]
MTFCHRMGRALLPRHCAYHEMRVLLVLNYVHLHQVPAAPL